MRQVRLKTARFILRNLTPEDVTNQYCLWMQEPATKKYIEAAKSASTIETLKAYIKIRENKEDTLFLGIFTLDGHHIGNIKYEPIDQENSCATMGILIGEIDWRSKGVAKEVIVDSMNYLNKRYAIKKIMLGVDKNNLAAITAYKKIGFVEKEVKGDGIKMIYYFSGTR